MRKYILVVLLSIFLVNGCVSSLTYRNCMNDLGDCKANARAYKLDLDNCYKFARELEECVCEEETIVETVEEANATIEEVPDKCPYVCPEDRECVSVTNDDGEIVNWQCVRQAFA
jgi:hypothetical protein